MKATEVRILPALEPGDSYVDPVFVLVETSLDDRGEPVTTIDHMSTKQVDGRDRWNVMTLGQSVPMTHSAALEWAVSYAASRNIPLVYERDATVDGELRPAFAALPPSMAVEDYAASLSGRFPALGTAPASSASK
ncbi:MAG TPA: hypothetical protein VE907_10760 [Gammaproteobacteria bacterium]|nr:hypothetical protein [Gammaproteobacteria bacterium]